MEVDRILRDSGAAPGGLAEAVTRLTGPLRDRNKWRRCSGGCPCGVPIGRLAAECCGDAHALDDRDPVGTRVLSAVRALADLPFAVNGAADSRRAAWATAGVHLDELSSLARCLGLPGDTRTALGKTLAFCREAGQPTVLTLRQLRCRDEPLHAGPGFGVRQYQPHERTHR